MFESLRDNLRASYNELTKKVTWPTWTELINNTVLVLIASAIFAIIVFVMDAISKQVLDLLYAIG